MLYLQIVATLSLLAILADLYVSARHARPRSRRADERDGAARAVAAAEQIHAGRTVDAGTLRQDRLRDATQYMLERHPGMTAARARLLVEAAVASVKRVS